MKECKIFLGQSRVLATNDTILNVDNCKFYSGSSAIRISPLAQKVVITNSTFNCCGVPDHYTEPEENACILLDGNFWKSELNEQDLVELICTDNVFEWNMCYPIAERARYCPENINGKFVSHTPIYIPQKDRYLLANNTLEGENATAMENLTDIDANKMYFNDSEYFNHDCLLLD